MYATEEQDEKAVTLLHVKDISNLMMDVEAWLDKIEYNQNASEGETMLFVACQNGHHKVAEILLNQDGVEINKASNKGQTPLYRAASNGHHKVVELLLRQDDILVNQAANNGVTPLCIAASKGHHRVVWN